ncbi:hypothetical protein CDD80_3219 [Ophiocordyceps camponoti-rufipedis]|uniref:Endopolyphosphatase n=1 Tax=Ophiocordyceps camponoti-rufipedis TaxID=2004952 RepID=A0A2C5Z4Y3_9HYPO|nr:hypothetical protein CDD80_3219 [Ophiocordyceps camponoti-rufipedis]
MRPLSSLFSLAVVASLTAASGLDRRLHGRFLHITDLHPDEFYRAGSDSEHGKACHRGHGDAGVFGAEKTSCDSPWALIDATFDWIARNVKDKVDFVVWTGDSARHGSDDDYPRDEDGILKSNRAVAEKFLDTFSDADGRLAVPVVPNFGNNDFLPHNTMKAGPNRWFDAYSTIWKRFIPRHQRDEFLRGGWFSVDVIPGRLAVVSLNTMYFFERNGAVDGCHRPSEPGYRHMEWLRGELQRMREAGIKAILMGHVPPARTDSKQNWDETCWQKYTLWLRQYRDVVTASVYGHMNIDHFMLQDTADVRVGGRDEEEEDDDDDDEEIEKKGHLFGSRLRVQSKGDYLQELRDEWSDLPDSVVGVLDEVDDDEDDDETSSKKKHKKNKYGKIGGKFAERYHVSLVSPSVVPNYFPTLRLVEYNVSGLEQTPLWKETQQGPTRVELRRRAPTADTEVPPGPAKESVPGPAHRAQPLTLTGYVQYYANLTRIGDDRDRFEYEVEYSTRDDGLYRLRAVTVKRWLHRARW